MTCDPAELARLARCLCFNRAQTRAVLIYLLCAWAKKKQGGGPNKAVLVYPASPGGSPNPINPILRWSNGGGATSYQVYVNNLLVSTQAGTTYNAGLLTGVTAYTWRVDSIGPGGTTTGDTWSFTTLDLFSFNGTTIQWTDAIAGTVTGTLAQLYALGNGDSLSAIDTQGTGVLVSFTNLDSLPALASLVADNEPNLNTLDISNCLALQTCSAFNVLPAGISSLDATNCSALTSLICHDNPLGTLTLTGCTNLQHLECQFTSLTILNLTNFSNLIYLDCDNCALTTLTLTNCTSLTYLDCNTNSPLTSLDCTNLTNLVTLECYQCALTSLILTHCSSMDQVDCLVNSLTSIDYSDCLLLTDTDCSSNSLTSLDVSANTHLKFFFLSNNPGIGTLDVSNNTALTDLDCSNCGLSTLNVSLNTALVNLACSNNSLAALNVSTNTSLAALICGSNQITSLNLSANTLLTAVTCENNRITSLDLSTCLSMKNFDCYSQYSGGVPVLTSINIGNSTSYLSIDAHDNALPAGPNGVDDVLHKLATNCLANSGSCDLNTAATNATPTGGIANADYVALTGAGWGVSINP